MVNKELGFEREGNGWGKLLLGAWSRGACRPLGPSPLAGRISSVQPSPSLSRGVELPGSPQLQGIGTEREAPPCPLLHFQSPAVTSSRGRGPSACSIHPASLATARGEPPPSPPASLCSSIHGGIAATNPGSHPGRQRPARRDAGGDPNAAPSLHLNK